MHACFCTLFAVVGAVLVALCAASFAQLSTQASDLFRLFAAETHKLSSAVAKHCSLHTGAHACRHGLVLQAVSDRAGAVVTRRCSTQTCLYACLVLDKTWFHKKMLFLRNEIIPRKS
jgi:hypothetical protein